MFYKWSSMKEWSSVASYSNFMSLYYLLGLITSINLFLLDGGILDTFGKKWLSSEISMKLQLEFRLIDFFKD